MKNARQHPQHSLTKRLTIGLVLLSLFFPVAVFSNESAASERAAIYFGCEGSVGAVVISNVDCALGVANAFDVDQSDGRAPWCDGQVDLTVYGCSIEQPDTQIATCHRSVPALQSDGVQRVAQSLCDDNEWVDGVLVRLAANEIVTSRCLALAAPGPSCIP